MHQNRSDFHQPDAAEYGMLMALARDAAFQCRTRASVVHCFHGFALTARRLNERPEGIAVDLALDRQGEPLLRTSIVIRA